MVPELSRPQHPLFIQPLLTSNQQCAVLPKSTFSLKLEEETEAREACAPRQATERGDFGALRLRASPLSFVGVRRPGRGQPRRAQRKQCRPGGAGDPEREAELETHRSHHAAGGPGQDRRGSEPRGKEGSAPKQSGARGPGRGVSRSPPPTAFSPSAPARGPRRTSLVRVTLQSQHRTRPLIGPGSGPQNSRSRGWRAPSRSGRAVPQKRAQRRRDGAVSAAATVPRSQLTTETQLPFGGDESFRRLCW